ncbi:MAG: copper amine oxidase N-terminal domain-containing protein [Firmicutes bacterium]|nr:copper amine oxidase N-terminal domain-containing protein [Bacillota bacterium]
MKKAIKKYSASPESTQFFCDFTNGISTITIDGSNISGKDKNGNTVFSHTYYYLETAPANDYPGFTFDIFATNEDAGEFKYFAFAPDTPASTYHIEFRYCGEYDELLNLLSGKYAYWLAAGIRDIDLADDKTTENVIGLFCTENMVYGSERSADSLAQLSDITGRWNCDMSAYKSIPEYANADMYIEINEDGSGKTYLDMTGSGSYMLASDYLVYAYNTSYDKKEGIYVAYTSDEGSKYSKYKVTEKNDRTTLDFYTVNGEKIISYYRENEKENSSKTSSSVSYSSGSGKSGKSSRAAMVSYNDDKKAELTDSEESSESKAIAESTNTDTRKNISLVIDSPSARINGMEVQLNAAPVIINGRTMVPIRFVSKNLGYTVDWDAEEKKAAISLNDTVIELTQNSEKATVNGEETEIDSPAVNRNGSIFVPLRFIAETLGAEVEWNAESKTVSIK